MRSALSIATGLVCSVLILVVPQAAAQHHGGHGGMGGGFSGGGMHHGGGMGGGFSGGGMHHGGTVGGGFSGGMHHGGNMGSGFAGGMHHSFSGSGLHHGAIGGIPGGGIRSFPSVSSGYPRPSYHHRPSYQNYGGRSGVYLSLPLGYGRLGYSNFGYYPYSYYPYSGGYLGNYLGYGYPYSSWGYGYNAFAYPSTSLFVYQSPYYAGYAPSSSAIVNAAPAAAAPVQNVLQAQEAVQLQRQLDGQTSTLPSIIATNAPAAAYQAAAEQAFRANDIPEAVRLANHAAIDDPQNGKLHLFVAQAMFAAGHYDGAAAAIHYAAGVLDVSDWGYVVENYKKFYQGENFVKQMDALVKYSRENPQAAAALFVRGYEYFYLGHHDSARKLFQRVLELEPRDQLAQRLLALSGGEVSTPPETPAGATPPATGDVPPSLPSADKDASTSSPTAASGTSSVSNSGSASSESLPAPLYDTAQP